MGVKVYTSCSHSNSFGSSEETRAARISILESVLDKLNKTYHLYYDSMLHGRGTATKTYCSWCESIKGVNDFSQTYNEFCNFAQPEVVTTIEIPEEEQLIIGKEIKPDFNNEWIELEDTSKIRVPSYNSWSMKDDYSDFKPSSFTMAAIPDGVKVSKRDVVKIVISQVFESENSLSLINLLPVIEAFSSLKGKSLNSDEIIPYISLAQSCNDPNGGVIRENDGTIIGTYRITEYHTSGEGEEEKEDSQTVIHTLHEYCPHDEDFISKNIEGSWSKGQPLFILTYAVVSEYRADTAFETAESLESISSTLGSKVYGSVRGKLVPVSSDTKSETPVNFNVIFEGYPEYISDASDYDITDYPYCVELDADYFTDAYYVCKIQAKSAANPNLWQEPKKVKLKIAGNIAFRRFGSWVEDANEEKGTEAHWCYEPYYKACKKATGSSKNYGEYIDNLKESNNIGETSSANLVFGLPWNIGQLGYAAKYIVCWGKVLSGSAADTAPCKRGISPVYWGFYGRNGGGCNSFGFGVWGNSYVRASGKVPFIEDVKKGQAGFYWNAPGFGKNTFWWQHGEDYYEVVYFNEIYFYVDRINWTRYAYEWRHKSPPAIYKHPDEPKNYERNYSPEIFPMCREVARYMPLPDYTDCTQYMNNMYVSAFKEVDEKWYQTGLFKFVFTVIAVVVTVVCAVYGGPVGGSLSAKFFSALYAIGLTVLCAVVINVVIKPVLTKLFGDVLGSIFSAILTVIASYYCAGLANSSSLNWNNPYLYANIATTSIQNINETIAQDIAEIYEKINKLQKQYEDLYEKLQKARAENLSGWATNKWLLANVQNGILLRPKTSDEFLYTSLLTDEFIEMPYLSIFNRFDEITDSSNYFAV